MSRTSAARSTAPRRTSRHATRGAARSTSVSPLRLGAVALVMTVLGATAAVLAPADAVQGQWQRLMYLHVPAAWTAYLAFAAVLVASVVRLRAPRRGTVRRRGTRAERCAQAAAEVGVVATTVTLVSGSIWGHAVWGVWWTWDARLTSTALMLFVYIGYLGLLGSPGRADTAARRASWLGVGGFVIVPVVHFSVVWWHTLHQKATVLAPPTSVPPIDPRMAVALALCVVAATALAVWAFALRLPALRPPTRDGEDGTALTAAAGGIQQTTVVPAAWADAGSREQLARR